MRPLDPRLLRHAAAARRFVGLTAGLAIVTAVLVIVQAQLLATTLDRAFLGRVGLAALVPLLVGLLAAVIGRSVLTWAGEVTAHRAAADVICQLRTRLVAHVLRLGPRHRDVPPTGELAVLATRGLDGLDGYFSRYLPTLLIAAVVPAMVAGRILFADWVSGLVIGLTVPLIPLFMVLVGLHTQRATSRQWRCLAVLADHFLDVVAGLDTLVAFGRARIQAVRLRALAEQHRTATLHTLRIAFLSALVLELLATLSVALVAVSIGLRLVGGQMDLPTALLVLVLAPEVYLPLRAVGARFHDCADGLASAAEVFAVLETPAPDHQTLPAPDPAREPLRVRGLSVAGRSGPVLDGLDFDVEPGTVVGIAGPSGCGKSTLLELLLGLRIPDQGKITIGNTDLADLDRDTWLRRVAWVPQHPVLLAGSVADNIALADPTASPDQVRHAARLAALDAALDTPVGEGGVGLSTGQQRRVALARAVLADRPLLLLDEPTEGVDPGTEAALIAALPEIVAGRSVILVSHRPEVLRRCDRVLQLPAPQRAAVAAVASAARAAGSPAPARPSRVTNQPMAQAAGHCVGGAVRWSLSVSGPQHARLALAVLLGSAALGCGVALTATSAWLISAAALHPPVLTLMVAIVAVRAFGLGKGVLRYAERLVSHDAALRALSDLRVRMWNALVRLGPAATARIRRGDLLSRLVSDVDAQQDLLIRVALPAACAAVVGTAMAVGLGALLPAAGVITAVGLIIAGIGAPIASVLAAQAAQRRTAALRADVLARTVEVFDAAPDLLAFGAAARLQAALAGADRRLGAALRRSATARGLGAGLVVLAIGITAVALTAVGIAAVRSGALPGPALAVLALTPLACAELISGLPDAALRLTTAGPAAHRLAELEAQPAPVAEPALAAGVTPPRALAARDLSIRWPGADHDAVTGVNLTLSAGTQLALTGASGSGKSTVVAALLRTLDPSTGAVLADGRDARELTGDEMRSGTAWCGARTHLFHSTLRANLLLARPNAADADLTSALRRAQLGDWLAGLPNGLDTPIGEYGSVVSGGVSGGERQRLGVARALLADRPVLLFDEPTAHLDTATADALAAELRAAIAGQTALIVTHRPEHIHGLPEIRLRPAASAAEGQVIRINDVVSRALLH